MVVAWRRGSWVGAGWNWPEVAAGDTLNPPPEERIPSCGAGPHDKMAEGDRTGNVYFLEFVNVQPGPPVVTAWHSPNDSIQAFGCLLRPTWSQVPASALGAELPCARPRHADQARILYDRRRLAPHRHSLAKAIGRPRSRYDPGLS